MKRCPVSGEPMVSETRHGVEIDVSPHGIWLDKGEFLALTEAIRHSERGWTIADFFRSEERPSVDHERVLKSPISQEPMQVENYMGVHIDWSPKDGVWLDSGELEAIINNLRLDPRWLRKVSLRLWEQRY